MRSVMTRLVWWMAIGALAVGAAAHTAAAASVTGVVQVQGARVKTTGAKSFKDVVVYLKPLAPGTYAPPAEHAVMDQRGLVFMPHVMAVQRGATVDFLNSDHDRHNVYFLFDATGETLDIGTWGPGQAVSHTFENSGLVITLCQLHLEMAAHILVLEAPFFTVAEIEADTQRAAYEIRNVPAGAYSLETWHKKLVMAQTAPEVVVAAGENARVDVVLTRKRRAK